ncbi:DUF211 domain-containing protein [Haloarculaceae archaeon H-GB2-1]|nr:DUF211 domain-containing protein [Haloarculaceae archaeon H-GB1-1]MEA5386688.1 DUF211 domain-containing protein [Haloarculaceae archaeon H-GB11]MEA5408214.1 DUF211 domain-containing protein [Haloarculaceae archaeon H-GB2-1]
MAPIRRLVLDVLTPYDPGTLELSQEVAECSGVRGVNTMLVEADREVQNLKLTVEGDDVDYDAVSETVENLGGSIHSVDQVACGDHLIEESGTFQD